MIENGKYKGFDENIKSQLDESSKTLIGAPITTGLDTAYAINAPEINWAGYKLYDEDLTSTGHMLSYIETQLDSKATTSSGDIWDDIKDSAYITSQINIYASYTTSKTAPDISWTNEIQNDPMYDGITSYSSLPGTSTQNAQGWFTSIDDITGNNQYVFMSSIYMVKSLANNILGYHGPSSTPIYLPSESGINGNFKSTVFCRTNTTPKAPSQGAVYSTGLPTTIQAYNSSNAEITGVEWSDGIPSGQEILWASTGIIEDSSPNETVWSTPRQMTDTATYDVEFAFEQENDATPTTPTDSNRHGGSGTQIWFDPANDASQDFTQMYWRAERECINGEWGNWIIVRIKGEQGTPGLRGAFKSTVFKRAELQPQTPESTEGTYDNPIPSGWSDGIPSGTGPVWSTWKTFTALNNNSNWAPPQLVADTPTYDVEFSPIEQNPGNPTNNSANWYDPTTSTLPSGTTWEDMIWRAERNRVTTQDAWSNWVITKIKGEDGEIGKPADYFEQRWTTTTNITSPNIPDSDTIINYDGNTIWKLTPQYEASKITWLTSRRVNYSIDSNVISYNYDPNSDWSNPMRMTGIDGVANPIHPVLKYTWHTSYITAPACATDNANPNTSGITWIESPGNGSATTYLWMIQGERHNSMMQEWDTDTNPSTPAAYWSAPVCLSGKNGEPGADGDDIEFIYYRYDTVPLFNDDNSNPAHWGPNQQDDYLGPNGYEWNDHPQGVTSTYKYEYCAYRRKTGPTGQKTWGTFSTPFPWSIYGENGLDGDGVEYIYYVNSSISTPIPPQFDLDPASFQRSEAYTSPWFDDPQPIDDTNNRYQYISTRKYKKIDDNNKYVISEDFSGSSYTIGSYTVNVGEKIWFPYSKPELWNWYINDGTIGDKYAMIYTRYSYLYDGEHFPVNPNTSMSTWTDHPGNPQGDNKYLWMSGKNVPYNSTFPYSGTTETWSDPICLTGDNGSDGADGTDIEFIYYRTNDANNVPTVPSHTGDNRYQMDDWPFVGTEGTDYYTTQDGIKTKLDQDHDTWSDNPFGISSQYKYEYCAIRKKNNEQWGEFSPVFLWSKFGEDGIDGDGVEYIYYVNSTNSYINPPEFDLDPNSFQRPEVYDSNNWHDDPQNLNSTTQSYQFVSSRKFRTITNDNKSYISSSFTGNSYNDGTYTVNVGDKIWFPYSDPTLWNWYTKDGTSAPRIVMIYRRNDSGVNEPSIPVKEQNGTYIISTLANGSQVAWAESPGSPAARYSYLWMTSAHYNNVQTSIGNRNQRIYTLDDNWQTPVCLTGESGHDGEDGTNIEFIYFRTSEDNNPFGDSGNNIDPSILSANQTEDYPCNSTTEDDISFYDPDSKYDNEVYDDTGVWSYMLHDVWTDNPIGVTSEYDYEWCAIRTTANVNGNAQWQTFGKPFLWSKYGEDGIDGDGIEYIFFKSADENEVVFSNNINDNNPNKWDMFDTDYQTDDFYGLKFKPSNTLSTNWWSDDPQGVDMDRRYEYVSKRKTITKNELFNIVRSLINHEGNSAISTYDNFIAAYENGPYDHGQFDSTAQYWNESTSTISSNLTIGELIETCYELFKQKKLKFWGKFSAPSLWSRYAVDGLVVNLTLESDNDMMAVAIDDNDVVTDSVSSVAKFELTHNTRVVDTSYYSMHIRESNMNGTTVGYGDDNGTTYSYLKAIVNSEECNLAKLQLVDSTYTLITNIPEGFDMIAIDNELRISSYAYIYDNTFDTTGVVEIGTERSFTNKVQGLHLSIDDIYQIQTDKNVIKVNGSELEKVTVYLKSLTSNNRITTTEEAKAKHLYLYYDNYKVMPIGLNDPKVGKHTAPIGVQLTLSSTTSVVEHTFRLYYDPEDTYADNIGPSNTQTSGLNAITAQTPVGTPLDIETVQRVFDGEKGNPGVDSKSMEYIYFVTDNISYFTNSQHDFCNPGKWNTNDYITYNNVKYYAYNTDDFPFVGNITSYHGWEDTQIGISEEHAYQFTSSRSFNTTTEKWEAFSEPVCTHNWGHTGEDGDGVEYIYYLNNLSVLPISSENYSRNPTHWYYDENYQSSEYIPTQPGNQTTWWEDNPIGVTENNKYEWASIRKYKTPNYKDFVNLARETYYGQYWNNKPFAESDLNSIDSNEKLFTDPIRNTIVNSLNSIINGGNTNVLYVEGLLNYYNHLLNHYNATTKLITNLKEWCPYTKPTIWAKYGETGQQGPTGPAGGSGLTFEFDNPSIQVAVNNNGIIKDNQTLLTYIHLYEGSTDKSDQITSVTIPDENNSLYHPFNTSYVYQDDPKFYKTVAKDSNNTYYYKFVINELDVNNNGKVDPGDYFPSNISYTLNSNLQMPLTIHYNGNEYTKYLTFTPIHYGENGQNAELFELSSETSVIRYNSKSDNLDYEPAYVEYQIHHVIGNNDATQYTNEIISYTDVNNEILNNGSIALYYHLDTEGGIQQQEGGTIVVGDQTRPATGTNSTTIFADTNTSLSGSGLYTTEGTSLGGTKTDTTSTSYFVTDVNTIQADSVVVVPVREVELESNTAEETLLTYLDNSLNWSSMFNSYVGTNSQNTSSGSGSGSSGGLGGITPIVEPTSKYDETNIVSVSQALNDYADYLETAPEQETNVRASFNIADIRNTANIINNVATSLGTITTGKDGSQSWALSNNEASIYVNDVVAQQDSEISTSIHSKVSAIEIQQRHDDLIQAQTIRDDLVQHGTASEYYDDYASPEYTKIASATIDETWKLLTMSGNDDITFKLDINNLIKNRQNWTPSSNGSVIINNNISGTVTLIRIRLVYDNSETLTVWDEDSLEIVYDGIDGVDSDVMEYIYYCPADTNQKSWNTTGGDSSENPANWTASNSPDYFPDGNTYIDDGTNGGWADHPHGVDSEHLYEYYSIRTKDGATGTWSQYETPVVWSHYGETGRDGDGVEYIYWRPTGTELKTWTDIVLNNANVEDPRTWSTTDTTVGKNGKKFQDNEYLGPTGSPWTDDPTGVTAENSYEYVSQRKYNGSTRLWEMFSKPAVWTNYGQKGDKGDTGDSGATAYVIDWTNDQINLAVDEVGYIICGENGQLKETSININSLNGVFGDNPNITMLWYTSGNEMPFKKFTKNYSEGGTNTINANTIAADAAPAVDKISFSHGDHNHPLKITVGQNYPDNKAYIPENGIEIKVKVSINGNGKSISNVDKILHVCGQHLAQDGQDGQNAITYELNPTNTAITYTNNILNPSTLSTSILRYNGNEVTSLTYNNTTGFGNNLYVSYQLYPNTTSYPYTGSINLTEVNNGSSIALSNDISAIKFILRNGPDSNSTIIDRENIPFIKSGEKGSQGFTGPIVRMRGNWKAYNQNDLADSIYFDGTYTNDYSNSYGPLYMDIVIREGKYYKLAPGKTNQIVSENNVYGLTPYTKYYASVTWVASSWVEATQFDFVATKLLYADQALINQISTHDLIATNEDGYPVAGVTSGSKMYDKNNAIIESYLNTLGDVHYSESSISSQNDPSNVRIFAGEIYNSDDNSYSLTYAPFNVRQDGTAYMSKANIVGDVNIGGQVNIAGNVNIEGNAKVNADVSVNTLTLNSGSFIINSDCNLPNFNVNEHKMFYVLIHKQDNNVCYINPQNNQSILATDTNGNFKNYDPGTSIELQNHGLYTAISTYMNDMSYWVVSKTGVYAVPSSRETYRKTFTTGHNINIGNITVFGNKVIQCKFTMGGSAPSSDINGFNNVQSVTVHCYLSYNTNYQVAINRNNNWIYNTTDPNNLITPSRTEEDGDLTNISHHYMSGSNSVNGWNSYSSINVNLNWNYPLGQSVDPTETYRIIKWNDTHGWSIDNNSHNTSDAFTTGDSGSTLISYYVEIVYYN